MTFPKFCEHSAQPSDRLALLLAISNEAVSIFAQRFNLPKGHRLELPSQVSATLVVISGSLSIRTLLPNGDEAFIGEAETGDLVGEAFAFDNCDAPLFAVAENADVEAWRFARGHFAKAFDVSPEFARAVARAMSRRLCTTSQRIIEAAMLRMPQRLAAELLRLAEMEGQELTITRLPTHQNLALRIGTQREAVTKELGRMRRAGVIRRQGATLQLIGSTWRN
ncbi:Crp/Fnr family transcriptional regulator [Methylopila sp. 73B]|uniref:Crp/Fnr family transcriptional regulator n=1 Tax=Methylopila sp. 73B TaxID=1120792 RepID=UPI0018CC5730|nr:Crp/Fnr family transcriptional regulator [Methylopila sp. 73B]